MEAFVNAAAAIFVIIGFIIVAAVVAVAGDVLGLWDAVNFV